MNKLMVPLCEHIKDNGERCRAIALRGRQFCYFHSRVHRPKTLPGKSGYRLSALDTSHSMQVTIAHVLQSLLDDTIDPRKANVLLRGLALANRNINQQLPEKLSHRIELTGSMQDFLAEEPVKSNESPAIESDPLPAPDPTSDDLSVPSDEFDLPPRKPSLSESDLAYLRGVVRKGPGDPAFNEAVRLLDAHISNKSSA
jgi:hypothetical protein